MFSEKEKKKSLFLLKKEIEYFHCLISKLSKEENITKKGWGERMLYEIKHTNVKYSLGLSNFSKFFKLFLVSFVTLLCEL